MLNLEIENDIHHFGKFLLIFELGKGSIFGPISGLGKSLTLTMTDLQSRVRN